MLHDKMDSMFQHAILVEAGSVKPAQLPRVQSGIAYIWPN
jgi:hypothetical protein